MFTKLFKMEFPFKCIGFENYKANDIYFISQLFGPVLNENALT